jgi:diadenosine tetraphosphate (Ap4A) HIT family hydrolase
MRTADPVTFSAKHRPLFATDRWGVLLYRNQTYLGRSLVYLRTRPLADLLSLSREERDELWDVVVPQLAVALEGAFAPDRLNYAHLANHKHHVHWHVVPRYDTDPVRHFAGELFVDTRPGQIFRTKQRGKVGGRVLDAIAAEVRAHLPSGAAALAPAPGRE